MAYLPVDKQIDEITHTAIALLGMPRATVEAMIAKRDGDRLALNRLRVNLNAKHRGLCNEINRAAETKQADARAEHAHALHDATKEQASHDRRQERQRLTPGVRVDRALTELHAMSTVRAVTMPDPNLANVKIPKVAEWQEPAEAPQVDVSPILAGLTYLVEQLEATLDAVRGLAAPQELAKLSGDIKDRVILRQLRGVHADEIERFAPWLGSSRSIRRLRAEHGQRIDGTDKQVTA